MRKQNDVIYFRRSAFITRLARYAVTLLFLLFILACILIFRKDITIENMQLLAKFISLSDGSSDMYEDEFSVNSSLNADCLMMRDNLAIIEKDNISLYYLSGQKLFSYNFIYANPAVVNNEHNILVYDINGTQLSIFNSFSKIMSKKFPEGVKCADIADDHYAVVTGEKGYKSAIKVYKYSFLDNDYLEKFKFLSSESYVTGIALSSDGKYLIASSVSSENGSYKAQISIFDIHSGSDSALYTAAIDGELPLKVGFSSDDTKAYVITDSSATFYNTKLDEKQRILFNQSKIISFFEGDNAIVFVEQNNLSGKSVTIRGYSMSGKELLSFIIEDHIVDIAFGKNKMYVLGESSAYEIIKSETGDYLISSTVSISSKHNAIVLDTSEHCYIIDNVSTKRLEFTQNQ